MKSFAIATGSPLRLAVSRVFAALAVCFTCLPASSAQELATERTLDPNAPHSATGTPDAPAVSQPIQPSLPSPASQIAVDIFAVRTWQPVAPPTPVDLAPEPPKPPPKPEAPPLPFRFLGKIVDLGKDTAFLLAQGDRVISVRVGDKVGNTYLVEKYEQNRLYFIYKPLKVRQSIFVGHES